MKGDAQTESRPPADFHAVSPTASTDIINNPPTPPLLHTLFYSLTSFTSLSASFSPPLPEMLHPQLRVLLIESMIQGLL